MTACDLACLEAYCARDNIYTARAEGLQEGMKKGMKKGLQEGMEKGLHEGKLQVARNLLATGMSAEQVAELTGLTLATVRALHG